MAYNQILYVAERACLSDKSDARLTRESESRIIAIEQQLPTMDLDANHLYMPTRPQAHRRGTRDSGLSILEDKLSG